MFITLGINRPITALQHTTGPVTTLQEDGLGTMVAT